MTPAQLLALRRDPRAWFSAFGRFRDEQTRAPTRGTANVLQRRMFEHYRRCQAAGEPCRMVVLKYRRAGSSTAGACLAYLHAQNYCARLGVIGTDYKASHNMLEMLTFYAEHDDFPLWNPPEPAATATVSWQEWLASEALDIVPFDERVDRVIATRLEFVHDSSVELYTARNPESARSAGLNGYHATECGRWQTGGEQDAGETLISMRNSLPKRGFHFALEESTAHGAQGAFYETCRGARWPAEAAWADPWRALWPLEEAKFGKELQVVFIFAAWFEDERHLPSAPLTTEQEQDLRASLDSDEKALLARYGQPGPRGLRLGSEVEATAWEQLAWRRGIIKNVCTKGGAEEFKQEYPSDPREAFRASGAPALDPEGVLALESMARTAPPEWGQLSTLSAARDAAIVWTRTAPDQATVAVWEEPFEGGRYLVACDPMSGAELVTGTGVKDRHSILVLRDAYTDQHGAFHRVKLAARLKAPCQWESEVAAQALWNLSRWYGGATIVVEGNIGTAMLKWLHERGAHLYQRQELDTVSQKTTLKLGWWTDESSRRILIATLQHYVREQLLEIPCPHVVAELGTLIVNARGKAEASHRHHDDDALALAMALECLPAAHPYPRRRPVRREPGDLRRWR